MTFDPKTLTPEQRALARWAYAQAYFYQEDGEKHALLHFPDPEPEPAVACAEDRFRYRRMPSGDWQYLLDGTDHRWERSIKLSDRFVRDLYALLPPEQQAPPRVVERVPEAVRKAYYNALPVAWLHKYRRDDIGDLLADPDEDDTP